MPSTAPRLLVPLADPPSESSLLDTPPLSGRKLPQSGGPRPSLVSDPLLTAEEVAQRLHVSTDWVWDHSSRKKPLLPVIRMSDGTLRYRTSKIEEFVDERERASVLRMKRR